MFEFRVLKKDRRTNARVGFLKTPHGAVLTPSYVMVGTHAEVRCLTPLDIPKTKTQLIIANTYHLWRMLGEKLDKFPGLHGFMKWNGVIMTDSGGFQVFSLGFAREHGVGKVANMFPGNAGGQAFLGTALDALQRRVRASSRPDFSASRRPSKSGLRELPQNNLPAGEGNSSDRKNLVRITEDGAYFNEGGENLFLNPEISIGIQEKLGADIILAFDECTSPLHDHAYTKGAMIRTHNWAKRSLAAKKRSDQWLYGIVQGGEFEDLRKESAEFIGRMPFDGFAIGGSLGRSRSGMFDVIKWSVPYLPEEKPRHLLGIGRIDDLFEAVEMGMDTFDCVIPTREARHGSLWTKFGRFDIKKGGWQGSYMKIQGDCRCPVCGEMEITRGELYELFKTKDSNAARLSTIHNSFFFNDLMEKIRNSIREENFPEFKKEFTANLRHYR
ncbi:MAG: tRNA guanosine(34) transglycosylase Tgt [Minisyncoccia bacterium]|jgi:tRNA-guanine family transglycosylase